MSPAGDRRAVVDPRVSCAGCRGVVGLLAFRQEHLCSVRQGADPHLHTRPGLGERLDTMSWFNFIVSNNSITPEVCL